MLSTLWMMQFFERSDPAQLVMAQQYAERALDMAQQFGDRTRQAHALCMLAGLAYMRDDPQLEPEDLSTRAVALARNVADPRLLGDTLGTLAICVPPEQARPMRLEALDCYQRAGDDLAAATELHMLYGLDMMAARLEDAQEHLEAAIALAESMDDEMFLFFFRSDLGLLRLIQGRHADAVPVVRRCLLVARRTGIAVGSSEVILTAACCTAWQGDPLRSATLHGAADTLIEAAIGNRTMWWSPTEQRLREAEQAQLRAHLGEAVYLDAYRSGQRLTAAQAVDLALSRDSVPSAPPVSSGL